MVNKKVDKYIGKNLKKGFSKKEIANNLKTAGYSDEEISADFKDVQNHHKLITGVSIIAIILLATAVIPWGRMFGTEELAEIAKPQPFENIYISLPGKCYELDANKVEQCLSQVTVIESEEDCLNVIEDVRILHVCNALVNDDSAMCSNENYPESTMLCKYLFILKSNNISECSKIEDRNTKESCESKISSGVVSANIFSHRFRLD